VSLPVKLIELEGGWMGVNHLWLTPDSEAIVTEAEARVDLEAQGTFLTIRYTWVYADVIQEGLLLIGCEQNSDRVRAAWLDSWHYADQMMYCQGKRNEDGSLSVAGSYAAPSGPDWGWWISLHALKDNLFKIVMHNVPPDGEAVLAVEILLERLN